VPRRLNDARLAERGVVGIFAHDKESTFFEGIRRVPPGHTLTVRPEGMRLGCYWDPATVPPPDLHADDDYVDAMRDRFTQAVRCRLRSAYPVASLLSGGLDSSAVSVVAARELSAMGRRLLTISSVLPQDHPGPERDERPFIDAITQIPGVDWCAVAPHVGLYDGLEDEFFWNEAPSAPRHDIYHGLYEAAGGGGARTLLDGRGGELGMTAHGKEYLLHLLTERRWLRLVRALRGESRVQGVSRTRHAFRQLVRPLFARRRVRSQFARRALAESPLAPELITRYRIYERLDEAADAAARRSRGSIRDQRVYAASRLQRPDGAYTEAFGTRGAFPFRDRRVIELSIHLPESLTRFRGYSRGLVRRSLDGMLPPSIQWRRDKMAFSPNYHSRLRSARDQMREELEGVRADDPIHRYLDLQKMRAALSALSEVPDWSRGAPGFPGPSAAVVLDHGLLLLRFVRWCGVE
jgi:asparagine synthase (glutamine-hydrolysing)